jgi:hypothetical protein
MADLGFRIADRMDIEHGNGFSYQFSGVRSNVVARKGSFHGYEFED